MDEVCVVVPIYKKRFTLEEEFSVDRTIKVLEGRDIFFVAPLHLDIEYYKTRYPYVKIQPFSDRYFRDVHSYSKLLLSKFFYETFAIYKYMLIAQSDAIILSSEDELDYFVALGYDYIGAPWEKESELYPVIFKGVEKVKFLFPPVLVRCGNGGFCLRNIFSMISILKEHHIAAFISRQCKIANEDSFFCYYLNSEKKYSIAPVNIAESFAVEQTAKKVLDSGRHSFAIHAYEKNLGGLNMMQQYIE